MFPKLETKFVEISLSGIYVYMFLSFLFELISHFDFKDFSSFLDFWQYVTKFSEFFQFQFLARFSILAKELSIFSRSWFSKKNGNIRTLPQIDNRNVFDWNFRWNGPKRYS